MIRTIDECFWGIQNGANIKQSKSSGGFPITRIETIADNKFNRDRVGYAGITDVSSYESYILEDEDLLMSHINSAKYLGRTVLYNRRANEVIIHGMNLLRLRANKEIINPSYAKYLFSGCKFKKQVSRITKKSVNQASFTVGDLKKIKISVPSILEQVQIVEKLDKIAWIIELRQAEIKKAEEIIKARFVELFGDPYFNPYKWKKLKIADAVTVEPQNGLYKPQTDYIIDGTGIPILRIDCFYNGEVADWGMLKRLRCTEKDIKRYQLNDDDIVINRVNSIEYLGKCAHITGMKEKTVFESNMMRMHFDKSRFNPIYITKLLCTQYIHDQIIKHAKKAVNQASINQHDVMDFDIYLPPLNMQQEYANFVRQIAKSKAVIEKSLKELETLQASLMQKYFS